MMTANQPSQPPTPLRKQSDAVPRVTLSELMQEAREIEIDHDGKIYRLRLTHANKLILTA